MALEEADKDNSELVEEQPLLTSEQVREVISSQLDMSDLPRLAEELKHIVTIMQTRIAVDKIFRNSPVFSSSAREILSFLEDHLGMSLNLTRSLLYGSRHVLLPLAMLAVICALYGQNFFEYASFFAMKPNEQLIAGPAGFIAGILTGWALLSGFDRPQVRAEALHFLAPLAQALECKIQQEVQGAAMKLFDSAQKIEQQIQATPNKPSLSGKEALGFIIVQSPFRS